MGDFYPEEFYPVELCPGGFYNQEGFVGFPGLLTRWPCANMTCIHYSWTYRSARCCCCCCWQNNVVIRPSCCCNRRRIFQHTTYRPMRCIHSVQSSLALSLARLACCLGMSSWMNKQAPSASHFSGSNFTTTPPPILLVSPSATALKTRECIGLCHTI